MEWQYDEDAVDTMYGFLLRTLRTFQVNTAVTKCWHRLNFIIQAYRRHHVCLQDRQEVLADHFWVREVVTLQTFFKKKTTGSKKENNAMAKKLLYVNYDVKLRVI